MKKVYWIARKENACLPSQKAALEQLFGEQVEIVPDPSPFESAEKVFSRYGRSDCGAAVVVMSLAWVSHLVELGLCPLRPEMVEVPTAKEAETSVVQRDSTLKHYRFSHFVRVRDIELVTEEVKAQKGGMVNRRVHWVTNFEPSEVHIEGLRQQLGTQVRWELDTERWNDAEDIANRFRRSRAQELAVNAAPYSVLAKLCGWRIFPLMPQMQQVGNGEPADIEGDGGRRYKFLGWRRIVSVNLVFEAP